MRWILSLLLLVVAHCGIEAQDFHDFDHYQGVYTREELSAKIKAYLEKDSKVERYYRWTEDSLIIGLANEEEYKLSLAPAAQEKSSAPEKKQGLRGVRIAIDPGHFGGVFARLEARFVSIPANETNNEKPVEFDEGTLTYLTAVELKSLLEAEGAEVMLTRDGISQGALQINFFEWLKNEPALWESKEPLTQLFRNYYNREDLRARAAKINAFEPDVAIIIHYNAHLTEDEKARKARLSHTDFNMIFVPGAFTGREMGSVEERYEFLRLLVTDSVEKSIALSAKVAEQFTEKLKVPLIGDDERASYVENASLKQAPGVYSRNLVLTRLVRCPVCYGETLIQNSVEEFQRLGAKEITIGGVATSNRVKEVADAYFAGLKSYFGENPPLPSPENNDLSKPHGD